MEHQFIEDAFTFYWGGVGCFRFGGGIEFLVEGCGEFIGVQPQQFGVGSQEAADIDGCGEHVVVAGFERTDVLSLDLGDFGDFVDRESVTFSGGA